MKFELSITISGFETRIEEDIYEFIEAMSNPYAIAVMYSNDGSGPLSSFTIQTNSVEVATLFKVLFEGSSVKTI